MILLRYLNRDLVNSMMAIIFVLLLIIISNMFLRYLSIVSVGNIEASAILKMITIMLPKYIAYLIPISFFFAILLVFGKLFSNNELTSIFACGIGWFKIIKFIMIPMLSLVLIEVVLTVIILPSMDKTFDMVRKTTAKNSLIKLITPGKIIAFNNGNQVIYNQSTNKKGEMKDIFIYKKNKNNSYTIITAPTGYADTSNQEQQLILKNGYFYHIGINNKINKGTFSEATQSLPNYIKYSEDNSIESIPTLELIKENNPLYQAELQWRLSFPISIITLTLIALALSKSKPRQGRYNKIIPALIIFIIYFNCLALSKSWIISEIIPSFIGLWWVHTFFCVTMLLILKYYDGRKICKK